MNRFKKLIIAALLILAFTAGALLLMAHLVHHFHGHASAAAPRIGVFYAGAIAYPGSHAAEAAPHEGRAH